MSEEGNKFSDEDLIARFQNGDEYAFDEIVHRYKDRLVNFVFRFLGQIDEAEDIVQDTFLKVYKNKNAYENIARFSTWIYTIAGNLAKTELRKRKRRRIFSISRMGPDEKEFELPTSDKSPEEDADSRFTEKIIQTAIQELPEKFRTVVILRDIQELSYDEISMILEVPLGTVKSRVNRARLKLRDLLKAMDH
ncbi:MAG: sigma-70 family RNA polymerase sigma factor [Candidatus Marinimicrobia bacterium]|nr:sigma-70 family RNA polymerase sigma factor [Candidatus Neomarinimicrobiota bacterium]MCH7954385.1 sigma-70 family RNA polymerase sigma factor [Candidatus Neomarinimicrobiota bacterium]